MSAKGAGFSAEQKKWVLDLVLEQLKRPEIGNPTELARRIDVNKSRMSRVVKGGEGLSYQAVQKLCEVAGIQVDPFIARNEWVTVDRDAIPAIPGLAGERTNAADSGESAQSIDLATRVVSLLEPIEVSKPMFRDALALVKMYGPRVTTLEQQIEQVRAPLPTATTKAKASGEAPKKQRSR